MFFPMRVVPYPCTDDLEFELFSLWLEPVRRRDERSSCSRWWGVSPSGLQENHSSWCHRIPSMSSFHLIPCTRTVGLCLACMGQVDLVVAEPLGDLRARWHSVLGFQRRSPQRNRPAHLASVREQHWRQWLRRLGPKLRFDTKVKQLRLEHGWALCSKSMVSNSTRR